jgi:hypothetical protein
MSLIGWLPLAVLYLLNSSAARLTGGAEGAEFSLEPGPCVIASDFAGDEWVWGARAFDVRSVDPRSTQLMWIPSTASAERAWRPALSRLLQVRVFVGVRTLQGNSDKLQT